MAVPPGRGESAICVAARLGLGFAFGSLINDAEDAARFYAKTFSDSSVGAAHRAPGDFPSRKKGDVLTVGFSVMGVRCLGLNGGPAFKHNESLSFQLATKDKCGLS
ncbi:MAG TPA: VOC family protein [Tepidisphaeraceae bacterium]